MATKPKQRTAGRPPFEPSDDHRAAVRVMKAGGFTNEDIRMVILDDGQPLAMKTFTKHFALELKTGAQRTHAVVIGQLMKKIKAGDTASIIFYLKTRMGWSDKQLVEITGKDGAPIAHVVNDKTIKEMTNEDLTQAIAVIERIKRANVTGTPIKG